MEVVTKTGWIQLILPEGWAARVGPLKTYTGHISNKAADTPDPGAPTVIVTGDPVFGYIKIRQRRRPRQGGHDGRFRRRPFRHPRRAAGARRGAGRAGRPRADRIVLTGDIAAGPQPTQTLDRLLGLGDRVTWVRGNADRELVNWPAGADDVGDPIPVGGPAAHRRPRGLAGPAAVPGDAGRGRLRRGRLLPRHAARRRGGRRRRLPARTLGRGPRRPA